MFIEEKSPSGGFRGLPYKFNAKELDEETGLYYYGARYYDPKTSVWISSDPFKELYPDVSSYVYCHSNPVNMIDPDGRTDFNVNGNIKTINDGNNRTTIKVSERQFNRAQKKFDEGGSGYDKYLNKLYRKNEYTSIRIRPYTGEGNPSGYIIGREVEFTVNNVKGRSIDWDEAVQNADDFLMASSMADGGLPFGDALGLLRVGGSRLGRLLFGGAKIAKTVELLQEFGIPKYYTYLSSTGESVFVAPNAMKHLEELAANGAKLGSDYLKLIGQTYVKSLNAAIDDVLSRGVIEYGKMYYSGGNEIMFGAPRAAGELPAVIHFR